MSRREIRIEEVMRVNMRVLVMGAPARPEAVMLVLLCICVMAVE
jgi:hypothetical protein